MTLTWNLEKRKVSSLREYPKNPRSLSKEQYGHLQHSIGTFGLIDKPIINVNGDIIGGHQRKKVLQRMKIKEVECWVPDRELTEKEVEELNIRLNKNTGDFDFDILANEWEISDLLSWGFDVKDFSLEQKDIEDKPVKCELLAKFENADDLREAEIEISAIISKYNDASYKVKVK